MKYQDKSKEELQRELLELRQEYSSLKASYDKDFSDHKTRESAMLLADFAIENSGDAVFWINPDGQIANCNQAACLMLGYTKEELTQISVPDIDANFPAEKWRGHFAELREKGVLSSFETEHRTKDNRLIPVEVTANYIEFEGRELNCAFSRDITERKIIENTLLFLTERNWAKPGGDFFTTIARYLGEVLSVDFVFIDRVSQDQKTALTLANYRLGEICPNFEYSLKDTPCENIYGKKMCSYPSNIQQDFPRDPILAEMNAQSYSGIPLWDSKGNPVGLIAMIHCQPLENLKRVETLLQLVAPHTGQEIEHKEAEKKLRTSEEKYRTIFENVQDVFYQTDLNGKVLDISPSIKFFTESNRSKLIGKYFYDLFDNSDDWDLLLVALKKTGQLKDYELRLKSKKGNIKFTSINARIIRDGENNPVKITGAIRDITERKKVEEALKESEFFFKESQKAAFIGSYKTDFITGRWESSTVLDKIFGISKDFDRSIPGWIDIVHPGDREMMNRYLIEEVIALAKPFNKEYRIIRKNDNQVRWVLGLGIVDFDDKGNVLSLIGTIQDITERKQNEYEIRKLNRAVKATGEVVFITDHEGIFSYVNPAFTTVYGHQANEVIGKVTPRILKSGQMDTTAYRSFWQNLINNRVIAGELINKTKDGRNIHIESSSNAILNEGGEIIGFIAIQKDITKRKQIEEELVFAKEKAEESDRLKSAFLANMSHEIRTPMNGILGFAALLKEPNLTSDELQDYIQTIQISGERMLNTINSIVDVSRIESGLVNVDMNETDVNEKVEFIFRFFKPEAEHKGLTFSFRTGLSAIDAVIKTDNEKLYGVLTNLIKNAIKFTTEGSIEFGYEKKEEYLEFFVKDTGIGIPKNQIEIIFERFRQGSESINRGYEGSGLGLSICKSFVEMLGGKIWVESEEGVGSVFYFTIPYKTPPVDTTEIIDVESGKHKEVPKNNLKILIVEDDEISHILLAKRLQKISDVVLHANTGVEAIEACKNNPDIDLILMDIRMPIMSGHEATRQIRQFNSDVIIIAQTAFALTGDREKAIESGCNDYISKPVNKAELLELIKKYFN